jgi:GNAT superfamily N-acetyltransferase
MTVTYRRATPDDAEQLVELRAVMLDEAFEMVSTPTTPWRAAALPVLRRRLAGDDLVAFVADEGGRLVACAVGFVEPRLPSPNNPSGITGHVASVATRPEHRRRGHSRAVVGLLLAWFEENGITQQELNASPAAEPLYRELGFVDHDDVYLRRRVRPES